MAAAAVRHASARRESRSLLSSSSSGGIPTGGRAGGGATGGGSQGGGTRLIASAKVERAGGMGVGNVGMTSTASTAGGQTGGAGGYSGTAHIYPPDAKVTDLTWDEKVRTLKDFVATYRLPLVARVRTGDLSKFLPPCGPKEDNVIQIHETRRRKIVLARRLQWEKRQNDYIVSGEQVEVPASFKGWFEVVPDDGRPVEYFDTVGGICSVKPRRFLVRTSTVGYQLSIEDGVSCWMPHEIRPGEVLTTGMVYMDNNNNSGGSGKKPKGSTTSLTTAGHNKGFFKRLLKSSKSKNKPEQDLKYLQCFDTEGKEIMIPLIMSGVFSPVGDASMANYDAVYELQDLIMAFGLPVNAQLIHANLKEKASCPQGVLRLYGTREEELAVLSRVEKDALISDSAVEKVEVVVDRELTLQRGLPRRRQSVHSSRPLPISSPPQMVTAAAANNHVAYSNSGSAVTVSTQKSGVITPITNSAVIGEAKVVQIEEPHDPSNNAEDCGKGDSGANSVKTEVELPKRVPKELKKSRSTALLDKLSVRRVRKERAKLKELRSDDVFSKRIVRNDLSYEDFFHGLGGEEGANEGSGDGEGGDSGAKSSPTSDGQSPAQTSTSPAARYGQVGKSGQPPSDTYGTYGKAGTGGGKAGGEARKYSMQDRDLPPIPVDSPPSSGGRTGDSSHGSRDSLYEHLPPAPQPPVRSLSEPARVTHGHMDHDVDDEDEEDGYMVPMNVRDMGGGGDAGFSSAIDIQLRRKPPAVPTSREDIRRQLARMKKCRSEMLHSDMIHHPGRVQATGLIATDDGCPIDIDELFNFNYAKDAAVQDRQYGTMMTSQQWSGSTSQLYGYRAKDKRGADAIPAWRAEVQRQQGAEGGGVFGTDSRLMAGGTLTRKSVDRLDLETRSQQGGKGSRSRSHQRMDPNATIRSHNLRGGKAPNRANLLELFHFSDSFRDLRDQQLRLSSPTSPESAVSGYSSGSQNQYGHSQHSPFPAQYVSNESRDTGGNHGPYGSVIAPSSMPGSASPAGSPNNTTSAYAFRPQHYVPYADSDTAAFRKAYVSSGGYPRAVSLSGLSDSYPKQGDDSAISVGSGRGGTSETPYGGFHAADSEYSYNEYGPDHHNAGSGCTVTGRDPLDAGWSPPDDISALAVQEVSRSLRYIGMKDRVVLRFANEQIDGSMLCSLDKRLLKEGFPELNALEIKKILDFVRGWRPKKK